MLLEMQVRKIELGWPAIEMKMLFDGWSVVPEEWWFGDEGCSLRGWLVKGETQLLELTIVPHGRPPFEVFERGNELCFVSKEVVCELEPLLGFSGLRFVISPPPSSECES